MQASVPTTLHVAASMPAAQLPSKVSSRRRMPEGGTSRPHSL
jgi:hypothetical protein